MTRTRRTFTKEFKAEAVQLYRQGDKTVATLARDLSLTETALRRWIQQDDVDAGRGRPGALTSQEKSELASLRRENKQLKMERDFLKRAAVFLPGRIYEVRLGRRRTRSLECGMVVQAPARFS